VAKWRDLEAAPDEAAFADAALATSRLDGEAAEALDAALAQADRRAVLAAQRWRLDDWRSARDTLSHRRFFNITELIGVRVEDPEVFDWSHRLALELVRSRDVDGLRIDHIDGLRDPEGYCRRLRAAVGPDVPILVEKILGLHETLPDWPIEGTTGYERLNEINRLFVDAAAAAAFDRHLVATAELEGDHASRLVRAKRQVLDELFAPELDRLARAGADLLGEDPEAMRAAIRGAARPLPGLPQLRYRARLERRRRGGLGRGPRPAAAPRDGRAGRRRRPALPHPAGRRRRHPRLPGRLPAAQRPGDGQGSRGHRALPQRRPRLSQRGRRRAGRPGRVARRPPPRGRGAPRRGDRSLVPLATHDTKRGPDTRARINALSLDPGGLARGGGAVARPGGGPPRRSRVPDGLDTWLIFQTAAGAWPIEPERLAGYMEKAIREAKRHTRWEDPDPAYEGPTLALARAVAGADPGQPLGDAIARPSSTGSRERRG
jgi:(1->4)-alpha-D-glucan 1-alpha-D-glucosylmutase